MWKIAQKLLLPCQAIAGLKFVTFHQHPSHRVSKISISLCLYVCPSVPCLLQRCLKKSYLITGPVVQESKWIYIGLTGLLIMVLLAIGYWQRKRRCVKIALEVLFDLFLRVLSCVSFPIRYFILRHSVSQKISNLNVLL